jgi:hypothetical protein
MHVVFGMALDGRAYPEVPGGGEGALGACVLGPSGLVTMLQTQLGLSGPATPPVVRIAAGAITMGIDAVAFWAAATAGVATAIMTSGLPATSSAASRGSRSKWPDASRSSIRTSVSLYPRRVSSSVKVVSM